MADPDSVGGICKGLFGVPERNPGLGIPPSFKTWRESLECRRPDISRLLLAEIITQRELAKGAGINASQRQQHCMGAGLMDAMSEKFARS